MIESLISPYGKIVSTRILRDHAMNSRGVGFARYLFNVLLCGYIKIVVVYISTLLL